MLSIPRGNKMATRIEIHPGIGIARVGPSDEFFLAPEPDVPAPDTISRRTGRLKRQAARFRLFECDRDANGVLTAARELGPEDGDITWTVHLVNRKGAAPNFAKPGGGRRNGATGNDAQDAPLIIDPGPRTVSGVSAPPVFFDTGSFMGTIGPARRYPDGCPRPPARLRRTRQVGLRAAAAQSEPADPGIRRQRRLVR